jgi:aryl sulfotransferase
VNGAHVHDRQGEEGTVARERAEREGIIVTPRRVRTYRNWILDSTRWDQFVPRAGDVLICTSYKSGTTWMQRIISLLLFGPGPLPAGLFDLSPWLEQRFSPVEELMEKLDRQQHRRFVKSHLPLDALPYFPQVRYLWVVRDTRDVFMSLWNHYSSHTDEAYERFASGDPEGGPLPPCPADPREFWRCWMTRAAFPWENDGWPYCSHHYHAASFWPYRRLPNLLAVHYNDLLADLPGQMRRVARFLGIDVPEENWPALVAAARFDAMKEEAIRQEADRSQPGLAKTFRDGAASFFFKGTNGRWCDILSAEDLALDERATATLDPDLRSWLETGSHHSPNARPLRGHPT